MGNILRLPHPDMIATALFMMVQCHAALNESVKPDRCFKYQQTKLLNNCSQKITISLK